MAPDVVERRTKGLEMYMTTLIRRFPDMLESSHLDRYYRIRGGEEAAPFFENISMRQRCAIVCRALSASSTKDRESLALHLYAWNQLGPTLI